LDDITITEARPEHLDAILTLARETTAAHDAARLAHYDAFGDEAHYDIYRNHFTPRPGQLESRLWVVLRGQQVVGHVMATLQTLSYDTTQDRVALIYDITLAEAERGKGLGRRAMEHVTGQLRDGGVTLIRAQSWWDNHASDRLFAGLNFTRVVTFRETRIAEAQPQPTPPKRWLPAWVNLKSLFWPLVLLAFIAMQVWAAWH